MKYKHLLLFLLPLLSLYGEDGISEPVPTIQTRLRSIGIGVDLSGVRAGQSSASEEFNVKSFQLGDPVEYRGPPTVQFYKDPPGGNKAKPSPIATAKLNPEWASTLLIWLRRDSDSLGILPLEDSLKNFPMNYVRFINLTPYRIGILTREGEKEITLPTNDWMVYAEDREAIYFKAILEKPDGESETIRNIVEIRPNVRQTVIFTFSTISETGPDAGLDRKMQVEPRFSYFSFYERENTP